MDKSGEAATGPVERWMTAVVRGLALGGGGILCAVVLLIVTNVVMRRIFNAPIEGEFEMAELVIGAAAFAFFPYAQWHNANIRVDLLVERSPPFLRRLLEISGQLMFSVISFILFWRLTIGTEEAFGGGEETTMLRIPVGLGYLGVTMFAGVLALTSAVQLWLMLQGRRA